MSADIPPWVKEIQPNVIRVPLTPYSTNGELFSQEEQIEKFFTESWQRWHTVSVNHGTPPHVFVMDFQGIKTLEPNNASNGLIFVLANFIGGKRPAYVAFDNLIFEGENNPWQSLNLTLEHLRRNRVAIARRQGDPQYQLIGARQFTEVRHWQQIFTRLASTEDWVRGRDFIIENPGVPISHRVQSDYMHWMAKEGLILQQRVSGLSYYRSLV